MGKIEKQLEYESKQKELSKMVQDEAKKLQDVIDAKEMAALEVRELSAKKVQLSAVLLNLDDEIKTTKEFLEKIKEDNKKLIESGKVEYDKNQHQIERNKKFLTDIVGNLNNSAKVAGEIGEFISKEVDAREKFLKEKSRLETSQNASKELEIKMKKERDEIESEKKNLEETKKYLIDLYGKIGSYGSYIQKSLEALNEALKENNIPVHFNSIPKMIEVDFNNFDKINHAN